MLNSFHVRWLAAMGLLLLLVVRPVAAQQSRVHFGTCDASAVVAVGDEYFLMATDEDNSLRLYEASSSNGALQDFDMSEFIEVDPAQPEADIEGVTTLGDVTIWITSHGRSKNGKVRESRQRLFATKFEQDGAAVQVVPVGKPYKRLLEDLLTAPSLKEFNLAAAEQLAPTQPGALNIEGLAAGPDGVLWVAFRNPVPQGKALLVPMENPSEVIGGATAKIGMPVTLDLGGLGVRSMEYFGERKTFLLVAGGATGGDEFALYEWPGTPGDAARRLATTFEAGFTPEAMAFLPGASLSRLLVLSDDGERRVDGSDCKDLADPARMSFRSTEVQLDGGR